MDIVDLITACLNFICTAQQRGGAIKEIHSSQFQKHFFSTETSSLGFGLSGVIALMVWANQAKLSAESSCRWSIT